MKATLAFSGEYAEPSVYDFFFHSACVHEGAVLLAMDDGLYVMDEAVETGFESGVLFHLSSLGSWNPKRISQAFVSGEIEGSRVQIQYDEDDPVIYEVVEGRIYPERRARGRHCTIAVVGFKRLEFIEAIVNNLPRGRYVRQ